MTQAGIARHLRALGGRGRVFELISEGLSNEQVLQRCLPQDQDLQRLQIPPNQPELFLDDEKQTVPLRRPRETVFDTTKITLTVPSELFQAIRLAAHAERKSKADLIIEILTRELSRTPRFEEEAGGEETL